MKNKILTTVDMIISQLKDSNYTCLVYSKKNKFDVCKHWYPTTYKNAPQGFELDRYTFFELDALDAKIIIAKHLQLQDVVVVSVPPIEYFIGSEELRKVRNYKFDISGNYLYIYENGLVIQIVELEQKYLNDEASNDNNNIPIFILKVQNSENYTRDLGIELAFYLHDKNFDFDLGTLIYQIELDELEFIMTAHDFELSEKYYLSNDEKTESFEKKYGVVRFRIFNEGDIYIMKMMAKARANNLLMSKGHFLYNPFNELIAHY